MAYNKNNNYIGNSDKQKIITNYLYKKCSALNYTSFCHDLLYGLLFQIMNVFKEIVSKELNFINRQLLKLLFYIIGMIIKVLFDSVFLIVGIFRSIFKLQIITSIPMIIIAYIILLVITPFTSIWYKNE